MISRHDTIVRLEPDDWDTLRTVRLAALRDAPEAFGASIEEEAQLDEAAWRERIGAQAWFVALEEGRPFAVACGGALREPVEGVRMLRAMWVAPNHRGDGTARAIVDEVVRWARADGATTLTLWATEHAARARTFYERFGFEATGEKAEMRHGSHPQMARYSLAL